MFQVYLEDLERDYNTNISLSQSSEDLERTLINHTTFLLNMDTFLSVCKDFSDKKEENKIIIQKVIYLIMDSIFNRLIKIIECTESTDNENKFMLSILECNRKLDLKQLFDYGISFVPSYLHHAIRNIISREDIIYEQFIPERLATNDDISVLCDEADIPDEFIELFDVNTNVDNTTKFTNINFNDCYVKDINIEFDKIFSIKDSITNSLLPGFISILSGFLTLIESVNISPELYASITPKLFDLSKLYFEFLCHSALNNVDDHGENVRKFLDIPNSNDIIQSISNVFDKAKIDVQIAKNLRWAYGVAVTLGGIAPQLNAGSPDSIAVVAFGNAIKMIAGGIDKSPCAKDKSFSLEVLPGLKIDLYDPIEAEKIFENKIESLGYIDQLEFFLKVICMFWRNVTKSNVLMLVVRQCLNLLSIIVDGATVIKSNHVFLYMNIMEILSENNVLDEYLSKFLESFRKKLFSDEGCVSRETNSIVLEEVNKRYGIDFPLYIVNFVYNIISSNNREEPAVSKFLNKMIDDLIVILQEKEFIISEKDGNYGKEFIPYHLFCLITYTFYFGLSPESKLSILTKMTNFIIENQEKKLHQLGLIRFLAIIECKLFNNYYCYFHNY